MSKLYEDFNKKIKSKIEVLKSSMIKKVTYKGSIKTAPKNSAYWKMRPVEERLAAVEFLRKQFYGETIPRLQRVLRVVNRKKS